MKLNCAPPPAQCRHWGDTFGDLVSFSSGSYCHLESPSRSSQSCTIIIHLHFQLSNSTTFTSLSAPFLHINFALPVRLICSISVICLHPTSMLQWSSSNMPKPLYLSLCICAWCMRHSEWFFWALVFNILFRSCPPHPSQYPRFHAICHGDSYP